MKYGERRTRGAHAVVLRDLRQDRPIWPTPGWSTNRLCLRRAEAVSRWLILGRLLRPVRHIEHCGRARRDSRRMRKTVAG
jgi:hypothetical protein